MVACKECKHIVWPNQIAGHLQNKDNAHRAKRRDATRMQREVEEWPDLLQYSDELPLVNEIRPPISELHVHRDGLRCIIDPDQCKYICRVEGSMKSHLTQKHPNSRGRRGARTLVSREAPVKKPWKQVACQRFFVQGRGSQYFEVDVPDYANPAVAIPVTRVERGRQILIARMEKIEDRERRVIEEGGFNEINPWVERTKWHEYLGGPESDRSKLLAAIEEPDPQKEPVAAAIWKAVEDLLSHCQHNVVHQVGHYVKMEAVRTEKQQTKYQPLKPYKEISAIKENSKPWKQMMAFFVRTQRQHDWASPKYKFDRRSKNAWAVLKAAAIKEVEKLEELNFSGSSGSRQAQFRPSSSSSTSDQLEGHISVRVHGIKKACLQFCIALMAQRMHKHEYDCALTCALAVLGVKPDGWLGPDKYPSILSAVIKSSRFMVVQTALNVVGSGNTGSSGSNSNNSNSNGSSSRSRNTQASQQEGCVDYVEKLVDKFMIRGTKGPMQWMLDLRTYGRAIHSNTTAEGKIDWVGDRILYGETQFTMGQLRGMILGLVNETRRILMEDVLDISGEEKAPKIPWSLLRDDPVQKKPGWNFVQDERNKWEVDGKWWLWNRLNKPTSKYRLIRSTTDFEWDGNNIDKFMNRVVEFREKLLVLMHISGGQPARGPELLSIRHSNTVHGEYRNIFVEDGLMVFVTRYHKGYTISGKMKIIHRYLPREVGELMVYYIWLVLPLQQKIEAEMQQKEARSQHMWPTDPNGKQWTSPRMREIMKRESNIGMGVQLTMQAWRDLAIGISRQYMRGKQAFVEDEDDEDGDGNEDDDIWDLAAGHGSQVAGMIYARGIRERDGVVESMRQQFRKVSETWHAFLKFESSLEAENGSRKRKRAPFEEDWEDARIDRWKKLRRNDASRELKKLMGDEAEFRGIQQGAIQAVMRGDARVAAVMGTGGGKSLIFMLPAFCSAGGTSIVVVPLIALRQDMMKRCKELGIECEEWNSRRPPDSAKIILVTPEAALTKQFATFVNRLKGTQQLDRIVIDECHVVLNDQRDFRPKLREMWKLNGAEVQMVMLTATLPVSMEEEFWRRMRVEREEVSMFRMSTTRRNIQYKVHRMGTKNSEEGEKALIRLVKRKLAKYKQGKVMVYCNSVKKTVQLADGLDCEGFYHDVDREEKKRILKDFATGVCRVIVATSAFGMGIDIADIRAVIHADVPRTLLEYAQESGRAGRDGVKSEAIIVTQDGSNGEVESDVEMVGTIRNGAISNVELVERLLGAGCKRVILDRFMDGRENRVSCEEGEEKCQSCEEETRNEEWTEEEGTMEEANMGEEEEEDVMAERPSEDDEDVIEERETLRMQRQERLVKEIRVRSQQRGQSEGEDGEKLLRHLEKVKGLCAVCTRAGWENNVHSIYWCRREDEAVKEYRGLKDGIRRGKTMEKLGGCWWCFVPQAWCNRWVDGEKGWQQKKGETQCRFKDVILGGLAVMAESTKYQKGLKSRMKTKGLNIDKREEVLKYLGVRLKWGELETWILLQEYWQAVKDNELD
jgi:RecQ family ATP-dependent DNA helicase